MSRSFISASPQDEIFLVKIHPNGIQAGMSNQNMEVKRLRVSMEHSRAQIRIVNHQFVRSLVFRSRLYNVHAAVRTRQVAGQPVFVSSCQLSIAFPLGQTWLICQNRWTGWRAQLGRGHMCIYKVQIMPSEDKMTSDKERRR